MFITKNSKIVQVDDYVINIENEIIDYYNLKGDHLYYFEPWIPVFLKDLTIQDSNSEKFILDLYFYVICKISKQDFYNRLWQHGKFQG